MASVSARLATTPRPSISPLSTASRTHIPSPEARRNTAMHEFDDLGGEEIDNPVDLAVAEVGRPRDARSSSLSDPEDDNDGSEQQDGIDDDMVDGEELTAHKSLEVDSEAETERLDLTPQKLRKHPDGIGRTPSKLIHAATADEELSEPPSPVPIELGAASSTSTVAATGRKRKRSETADSSLTSTDSETGQSPRKRSHEAHPDEPMDAVDDAEPLVERAEDTPVLDEARDTPLIRVKGPKGRKGKPKGKKAKEATEEVEPEQIEESVETVEEPSEEDPVKTEEQRKLKKEASTIYEDVTKQFRAFKEKLYNERLGTLTSELQLLSQKECLHPEYLRQVACVDARLQKQISEAHAYHNYKLRCIRERTLGERSQLHSQYFQRVRDIREDALYKLGEDWYAIQRERRQSHQEKDDAFVYKFPSKKSVQIRQQAKYNLEVSILSGVAKYVGFPAAPEVEGVDGDRFEEDLRSMKISRRVVQPTVAPPRTVYLPGSATATTFTQNERLAHEQYLEQNPWARPQASMHAHGTPGISHTPDWADGSSAKHLPRPNQVQPNSSPFATPIPQKSAPAQYEEHLSSGGATVGLNSDGVVPEAPLTSSVLAAPPTTDRLLSFTHKQHHHHHQDQAHNQTSPLAFPKPRENGTATESFPGFRNISGTSTIDAPELLQQQGAEDSLGQVVMGAGIAKPALLPSLPTEESTSAPQVFDTSQLHMHLGDERREVYAGNRFRAQEGAFGTPAPLRAVGPGGGG